jgi:nucleoside 2-deoxyribosyltransferase
MKIYIAGAISGQSGEDVISYFKNTKALLIGMGYQVFSPMTGKSQFRNEISMKSHGYDNPISTNHAIIERDCWMVSHCDVLYCNLTMAEIVSIGSTMELAWGHILKKHTVLTLPKNNIHRHAFILEAADIIFEEHEEALSYLAKLILPERR